MKLPFYIIFLGLFCTVLCVAVGSFDKSDSGYFIQDPEPSPSHIHESWAPEPGPGWGWNPPKPQGHSSGSYYHYFVPVVGQGWQQQETHGHSFIGKHDHHIWALLLILGISLLGLKLMPLLLIPLLLSLLALLLGGAMMMAMMMMMMMPMMMPQANSRTELVGRAFETVSKLVSGNVSGVLNDYISTINFDNCPQKMACEIGSIGSKFLPSEISPETISSNKRATTLFFQQFLFEGKAQKIFRRCEKAFWKGTTTRDCSSYKCHPSFRETSEGRSESNWLKQSSNINPSNYSTISASESKIDSEINLSQPQINNVTSTSESVLEELKPISQTQM